MANVILYTANAIAQSGVVIKNGTGGGAPALDENADWPMSHLLSPDRETYWRMSDAPPSPLYVDFDLGSALSIRAGGLLKMRVYGGGAASLMGCQYIAGAGAYDPDPAAWSTAFGNTGLSANNALLDFGPFTARYWRFHVDAPNDPFSGKLWLVKDADRIDLGHDWSVGTEEEIERLRQEVISPAGMAFAFEPAQNRGSAVRGGTFLLRGQNEATRDTLRDKLTSLDTRFVVKLGDGGVIETSLDEGVFRWGRTWSAPETFDFELTLTEHP